MARNIEVKAAVRDFAPLLDVLTRISTAAPVRLAQVDTFFSCRTGRLKLRRISDGRGELIFYIRPNELGPKASNYMRVPTSSPNLLRDVLASAHGAIAVVRKQRTVYMVGRTRVHLDDVEGLGRFVELEVVLGDGESAQIGIREARGLMAVLGLHEEQLVAEAYVDLVLGDRTHA